MIYDFRMRSALVAAFAALLSAGCAGAPRQAVLRDQDLRASSSQELIRASRSGPAGERRLALLAMARIQSPAYVDAMAARLRDGNADVRLTAVFALGQLGLAETPAEPEARAALTQGQSAAASRLRPLLLARSYRLRARAYEALGKVGAAADEASLSAGLRDRDPEVRGTAALALFRLRMRGQIPDFSTATVRALRVTFSDPDPEARWRAIYPFSRYAEPRLAEPLAEACGPDEGVLWARVFACRALGLIGKSAPWEELVQSLASPEAALRLEAARSLGLTGRAEYLTEGVFTDDSAHVRAAVADALAAAGDKKRAYQLDAVDEGDSVMVRAAVTAAYARLKPRDQALRRIKKDWEDPRWWVRSRAWAAVRELGLGAEAWAWGQGQDSDPRVASEQLETFVDASNAAARSTETAVNILSRVLLDTGAAVEVAGAAVDLAPKHPSAALLPGLKTLRDGPLGRRYPELASDAAEAYDAVVSTLALTAPKLAPPSTTPLQPSPWLMARLPPTSVIMKTEKGEVEISLAVKEAPIHAAAFADSVRRGVYDGLTWHRVVSGFVVQGGDPLGSGWGDCGFSLRDEINELPFERGVVGMPKAGKDTGGCQLFVTLVPTPHLDGRYTVFGRVTRGMDVVDTLEPGDKIVRAWITSRPTP